MDSQYIALGILIPFVGTSLGSACVYFLKGNKTTGGKCTRNSSGCREGLNGICGRGHGCGIHLEFTHSGDGRE